MSAGVYKRTQKHMGVNHPRWKGGKPNCKICGKKLSRKPYEYCIKHRPNRIKKEDQSPYWKGESVSYRGLHAWVVRNLGQPRKCEFCGTTESKLFDWANKSHEYKRDLGDWIRLCRKCHISYDKSNLKQILTKQDKKLSKERREKYENIV